MEQPADREPGEEMRNIDRIIAGNEQLANRFNEQKKSALEWKAMWLCEVMRGDHAFEETYKIGELDRARENMDGWSKRTEKNGDITAEYQS